MKSYKVEIQEIQKYIIDVQADNEQEAEKQAYKIYQEDVELGIIHFKENGDMEAEIGLVFDVTGTDDDAFLLGND